MTTMREALEAAESWIDRWAPHVGNCEGGDGCTCGRTAVLHEASTALSPVQDMENHVVSGQPNESAVQETDCQIAWRPDPKTVEGWQPIETAPKDGTRFLFTTGSVVSVGFYINGKAFAADSFGGERNTEPTHWMPLPAPPRSSSYQTSAEKE